MVCRLVAHHRLGGVSGGVHGHHRKAQRAAYLRGQLVLPVLHHYRCDAALGQQPVDPGFDFWFEIGAGILGRARRHDAMVVWPQRCGLFPDSGLLGDDVLLCAQTSRAPGVQL